MPDSDGLTVKSDKDVSDGLRQLSAEKPPLAYMLDVSDACESVAKLPDRYMGDSTYEPSSAVKVRSPA